MAGPSSEGGASCSEVQLEHADGVAAHELVHDVVGKPGHQLLRDLLRVRPRRVGVRVVGLERRRCRRRPRRATRCRAGRGRSSRTPGGSSRSTAARARCRARRPTRGARATRRRPARGCTGSSRSGPRCTRASASGNRTSTPENRKSVSDAMALPKLSVAAPRPARRRDVAGIFDDEPMCMHTTVPVSCARREERVPVAGVDARQAEVRRDLAEAHGVHAAGGVAAHLGRGELGVPQRDDGTAGSGGRRCRRTTPRPSSRCTRSTHARASSRSLASRNVWPQKRGKVGKRQRRLDPVELHVVDARLRARSSRGASRRR